MSEPTLFCLRQRVPNTSASYRRNRQRAKRISTKTITFASVLTFVTLGGMVEEAKAYLYCELKGGSPKKEWGCKECSPNAICGVKEECQTKCAKAETPKQAEDCLTIYCSPPQARSKRR